MVLIALTTGVGAITLHPGVASAQEADLDQLKAEWQARYRDLRREEARLVETVRLATKEYADANRRNYRRSGVRHFHRTNANEAKAALAEVRQEIKDAHVEVVAEGGLAYWLEAIDDEPIDSDAVQGLGVYEDGGQFGGKGAYPKNSDNEAGQAQDDGRNPLYSQDDDAPAELEEKGDEDFDYNSWRANRAEYEKERAPERHLNPNDPGQ